MNTEPILSVELDKAASQYVEQYYPKSEYMDEAIRQLICKTDENIFKAGADWQLKQQKVPENKYAELERQVVTLLGLTGCGNVLEVIEYIRKISK